MDQKTAKLILKIKDLEDIQEAYEQIVFEIKNTLLIQGVIPKVLRKRQERLYKIQEAYTFLAQPETTDYPIQKPIVEGENWVALFLHYERNKSLIKQVISMHSDANLLIKAIESLIENMKAWSKHFEFDYTSIQLPTLGKEMDSMLLLKYLEEEKETPLNALKIEVLSEYGRILKNLEGENP